MKTTLFRQHGGPEVLEYTDFPAPEPKPGEALVRLRAAALNRMDVMVREGWPGLNLELPHINGADGAGEIVTLPPLTSPPQAGGKQGEGSSPPPLRGTETVKSSPPPLRGTEAVKSSPPPLRETEVVKSSPPLAGGTDGGLKIRDHVVINSNLGCGECYYCLSGRDNMCRHWHLLGETVRGTYAEYISLPPRQLYKLPDDFDFHIAAGSALVYQTAWHSLITRGKLQAGETVLIVGAGGGVNTASIDIAKYCGAQVVVVGSDAIKLEKAGAMGADILIDRSKNENWSKAVFLATNKQGVDIVVDNVGTTFMHSLRALKKGGRLLTVGNSGGPKFEIDNRYMFAKHLSIIGSTMSNLADFATVMDLVVAGKLKPALDKSFPLSDAADAQECLWYGKNFGKVTLEIE